MTQLQPEIMIVDGLDQDAADTGAVGAQGVRVDLIACQGANALGQSVAGKALLDALGEGLFCMGNTVNSIGGAEFLHPILFGIGNHANLLDTCEIYSEIYYSQFPKEVD